MPLEGRGGRLALGWPRTPAGSKAACEPEPALQARGQDPAEAQLCQEPLSHGCRPTYRPPGARTEPSHPEARTGAGPCPGTPPESDRATKCKPATRACSHRGAPQGTPDRADPGGWSHEALPSRWRNHGRPCVIMAVTSCGAGSSTPPRAPGQPPGVWVQGQDQGRVWGRPRAGGLDSLDPHLKAAPSPPQARSRAAQSPNSFNCFSNLKIKQVQRHLQGGAGFRLGLCSQGWGASQGLSAPALGADPSSLRAPFSSVPLPVCLREPTTGSPTSVHRGLAPPPAGTGTPLPGPRPPLALGPHPHSGPSALPGGGRGWEKGGLGRAPVLGEKAGRLSSGGQPGRQGQGVVRQHQPAICLPLPWQPAPARGQGEGRLNMPSATPTRFCRRTGAGTPRGPRGDQCGPDISGGRGAGGVTGGTREPQANAAPKGGATQGPPFRACSSLQGAPRAPGPLVLLQVGLQARSSESTRYRALRGRCVSQSLWDGTC